MDIVDRIKTDDEFLIGALLAIYSQQEIDEQHGKSTHYQNGKGFNAVDAAILSSISEFYLRYNRLSHKQIETVRKAIKKYKNQLIALKIDPMPNNNPTPKVKRKRTKFYDSSGKYVKLMDNQLIITFPFCYETVSDIKEHLIDRKFEKEPKPRWISNCTVANIEKLKELDFKLHPKVKKWLKRNKINQNELPETKVPGLLREPFKFQKQGVSFLNLKNGRALIADDMGLGKSIQSISYLHLHPEIRPALIICPASVKYNWEKEFKITTGDKSIHIINGKKTYDLPKKDIYIINYDILNAWLKELKKVKLKAVVADEVHMIKNSKAIRTKAVKNVCKKIDHVIGLSGTPIENRPIEIFNMLQILDPETFKSKTQYGKKFCDLKFDGFSWNYNGSSNHEELHDLLTNTIMLRRKKEEVLTDLPDKIKTLLPLELNNMKEYSRAETDFIEWVRETKGSKAASKAQNAQTLSRIEALKQVAVNGKLKQCIQWIDDFLEGSDEKLVVFATHKHVINELMKRYGHKAVKIDGSVQANKRQQIVDTFQNDSNIKIFVGNIKAAGVGITLTAASNVVFLELGWTPSLHSQAADRCHRIGQKNAVNVWYLIAKNTIEEDIMHLLQEKEKVINKILDGDDFSEFEMLNILLKKYE